MIPDTAKIPPALYRVMIDSKLPGKAEKKILVSDETARFIYAAYEKLFGKSQPMEAREKRGGICWLSEILDWKRQGLLPSDFDVYAHEIKTLDDVFQTGYALEADHIPTGETWLILAVHRESGKCFAAGYPPSIAEIADCYNWKLREPLDEQERIHIKRHFRHTID